MLEFNEENRTVEASAAEAVEKPVVRKAFSKMTDEEIDAEYADIQRRTLAKYPELASDALERNEAITWITALRLVELVREVGELRAKIEENGR